MYIKKYQTIIRKLNIEFYKRFQNVEKKNEWYRRY